MWSNPHGVSRHHITGGQQEGGFSLSQHSPNIPISNDSMKGLPVANHKGSTKRPLAHCDDHVANRLALSNPCHTIHRVQHVFH